eukprot:jgi/Chlat1/991/Chrsp108S01405
MATVEREAATGLGVVEEPGGGSVVEDDLNHEPVEAEAKPDAPGCPDEVGELLRCVVFAANKHRTQRRKDREGTAYINHPLGVATLLWQSGVRDMQVLQAALLHDTIEDTDCTQAEIKAEFGKEVNDLVVEVSDDKRLPKQERKQQQIDHAPHKSNGAKHVKLADKLHNLTDLMDNPPPSWSVERCQAYFGWASEVVAGLRGTNAVLEEKLQTVFAGKLILPDGRTAPAVRPGYQPGDWRRDTPLHEDDEMRLQRHLADDINKRPRGVSPEGLRLEPPNEALRLEQPRSKARLDLDLNIA